jgi:hypothetical protein
LLKEKKEAKAANKCAQDIELLMMTISINQHDPAKMERYKNQLDMLLLGIDPNASFAQTQGDDLEENKMSECSSNDKEEGSLLVLGNDEDKNRSDSDSEEDNQQNCIS